AELLQCLLYFVLSGFVEAADMHVPDAGLDLKLQVYAKAGNFSPNHVELQRFFRPLTQNGDMDVGAFGAFEQVSHFAGIHIVSGLAVHGNDYIARTDTGLISRSTRKRS